MNLSNMHRARLEMQARGVDAVLASDPATITWLCGEVPFDVGGPNPFAGGPVLMWLDADRALLVVPGSRREVVEADGLHRWSYPGYTVAQPMDPPQALADLFLELLASAARGHRQLGVEQETLPASLYTLLGRQCPTLQVQSAYGFFTKLRAVKTDDEVEKIRGALALCDLAQQCLTEYAQPGVTELELFGQIYGRLVPHAGGAFPVTTALVAGRRIGARMPGPSAYTVARGDPILFDIALQHKGYWGDNCNTIVPGTATRAFEQLHRVVFDALTYAKTLIAPGVAANQVDTRVRAFIRERGFVPYPHHTGHGIGVSYHEAPRIVPYNAQSLEQGMVICLEPGIYDPDIGGVRLEDVVRVTSGGCETLSQGGKPLVAHTP